MEARLLFGKAYMEVGGEASSGECENEVSGKTKGNSMQSTKGLYELRIKDGQLYGTN